MKRNQKGFIELGLAVFYGVAALFSYAAVHSASAGKSAQIEAPAAQVATK